MSTRSAAKRQMRSTRSSGSGYLHSGHHGVRNTLSPGLNRRRGAEKSTAKVTPRKRAVDEEETKGSEADEEAPKEEEEATRKRGRARLRVDVVNERVDPEKLVKPTTPRKRLREDEETKGEEQEDVERPRRTRVDVANDTGFLRVLVAARQRMEMAPRKMEVWEELAKGYYSHGRVAKARVEWLQQVRKDRRHLEHPKLTSEMVSLLEQWATRDKTRYQGTVKHIDTTKDSTESVSPRKRQKVGELETVEQLRPVRRETRQTSTGDVDTVGDVRSDPSVKNRRTTPTTDEMLVAPPSYKHPRMMVFDSSLEESIMQIVLDHMPVMETAPTKIAVWEEIARKTQGRYTTGKSAQNHIYWLVKVLNDPNHRAAKEATPHLRQQVKEYVTISIGMSTKENTTNETRTSTRSQAVSVSDNAQDTPKDHRTIDGVTDELLVRLAIERDLDINVNDTNSGRWNGIATAVKKKNSTITSGPQASKRLSWLLHVLNHTTHDAHATLTNSLRQLLMDYKRKMALLKGSETVRSTAKEVIEDVAPRSTMATPHNEDTTSTTEQDNERDPRQQALVLTSRDEQLMRLVLELRPFDADRSSRTEVWAKVIDALQDPKFTTGIAAQSRVRWLQRVYQQPSHPNHGQLPGGLKKMLQEYDQIYGAARAEELANALNAPVDVSEDEDEDTSRADPLDSLLIHEILRVRPFHTKIGQGMVKWKVVATNVNRTEGVKETVTARSCLARMKKLLAVARTGGVKYDIYLTKKQRAMLLFIDALQKIPWPTGRSSELTDDHKACLEKIRRLLNCEPTASISKPPSHTLRQPTSRPPTPRPPTPKVRTPVHFTYEHTSSVNMDPIDVLQQDIVQFRATATRDRISREHDVAELKYQVSTWRVQLDDQVAKWDDERREQRDELRTIMELLKNERQMHASELAMVLQVVEKEREDRRQEFGTLMNLVSRAMLGRNRSSTNSE